MSLLTVVQSFMARTNLPIPQTVMGSSDTQVVQIRAILEEEGGDLSRRGSWEGLVNEATHTTLATEDQGAITALASNGFRSVVMSTFWDRTDKLPVPLIGSTDWQALKALVATGPRYQYRLRKGKVIVTPVPPAGNTWAFEYVSKNWILGIDGTTYKEYFTLDTDTILLPESLVLMGLRWRWKKEKGLEYAEDLRTYEMQVKDAFARDGGKPTLCMDGDTARRGQPGIFIPNYNTVP